MPTPTTASYSHNLGPKSQPFKLRKTEGALDLEREPAGVTSCAMPAYSPFGKLAAGGGGYLEPSWNCTKPAWLECSNLEPFFGESLYNAWQAINRVIRRAFNRIALGD